MPTELFVSNIKGLIPLIDRRKVPEPFVVEGQNFLMDADGPVSGLGRSVFSYKAISLLGNIQTFKISETLESLLLNDEGVFRVDTESGKIVLLYKFITHVTSEFPWSMAAVGNKYYFARKDSALIEYDIVNDAWSYVSGGSIPENIYACTESDGRLIVLTPYWAAWSAIGNGRDFTASTSTGAGAQALTKLGLSNPKPLGLKTVADGFLTFLSSGIMKSQSIVATNPYRHVILSRKYIPVNPYCLTSDEDDAVIILTKTGFYRTAGDKPSPWQAVMGEYFHSKVIPTLDVINNQNSIQINFNTERSWFTVWIAENQQDYLYTKAFILNAKTDQWGSLDDTFVCLTDFHTLATTLEGFIFGLVDVEGSIFRFDSARGIEYIENGAGYLYHNEFEDVPARVNDEVLIGTFKADFAPETKQHLSVTGNYYKYSKLESFISPVDLSSVEKEAVYDATTLVFKMNTSMGLGVANLQQTPVAKVYSSLNSFVNIGPIRLRDNEDSDRYSSITNINIGTLLAGDIENTFEDWNSSTQYPVEVFEDWFVLTGEEDWDIIRFDTVNYDFDVICTLDAETPIVNFTPTVMKTHSSSKTDFYSCNTSGIYHLLAVKALEEDQNFHVKTIDLSGNLGGRI